MHREHSELKRKLDELQDSQSILNQIFQAIQSRPEAEAAAIFKRIREGADYESVMRHISAGDILLQLHVTPETRYRYVFPYRTQMPTSLQSPHNPYIQSLVYETAFMASDRQTSPSSADEKYRAQYLRPLLAAEIVDPRLDTIKPSMWTNVCTDDDLMRVILRAYFLAEYHRFTFFHKDHFLEDMMRGSNQFCSPLLVNAVLALACVSVPTSSTLLCTNFLSYLSTTIVPFQIVPSFGIREALRTNSLLRPRGSWNYSKPPKALSLLYKL
jgi:hypothetical protein